MLMNVSIIYQVWMHKLIMNCGLFGCFLEKTTGFSMDFSIYLDYNILHHLFLVDH